MIMVRFGATTAAAAVRLCSASSSRVTATARSKMTTSRGVGGMGWISAPQQKTDVHRSPLLTGGRRHQGAVLGKCQAFGAARASSRRFLFVDPCTYSTVTAMARRNNGAEFWGKVAEEQVDWFKRPTTMVDTSNSPLNR